MLVLKIVRASKLALVKYGKYGGGPRAGYTSSRETSSELPTVLGDSCPLLMSGSCTPYHMLLRDRRRGEVVQGRNKILCCCCIRFLRSNVTSTAFLFF